MESDKSDSLKKRVERLIEEALKKPEIWAAVSIAILLVAFTVFDSFYRVDKTEEATVRRFGEYIETVGPGLHGKLPFIDYVEKTDVTTVHRVEIGFRTKSIDSTGSTYKQIPDESEMLTGDDNIVWTDFVLQYRSADAKKWQFTVKDPDHLLKLMAEAAMRLVVGKSGFDKVATVGKAAVQTEVQQLLQVYVDKIDFGAQIVSVQMQDVQPPSKVVAAFKDVVNAREEKDRLIQVARQHANKVLPDARGQAAQIKNEAEAYAKARVLGAEGDVQKFNALLEKYKLAPEVTSQRLAFETQERVLRGKNIVVDPGTSGGLLKLFQINQTEK